MSLAKTGTGAWARGVAALVVLGVVLGGMVACKKKEDAVDAGPAEQMGRKLDQATDKAGRELTQAAETANQQIQDAARETADQANKAAGDAGHKLNQATEAAGRKLEQAGEKMQETAQEREARLKAK
jgi:hypothetical protein